MALGWWAFTIGMSALGVIGGSNFLRIGPSWRLHAFSTVWLMVTCVPLSVWGPDPARSDGGNALQEVRHLSTAALGWLANVGLVAAALCLVLSARAYWSRGRQTS